MKLFPNFTCHYLITHTYCVPSQSMANNRSPTLLRSGIYPCLHVRSDFCPSSAFFFFGPITSNRKSKGSFAMERLNHVFIQHMQDYISQIFN